MAQTENPQPIDFLQEQRKRRPPIGIKLGGQYPLTCLLSSENPYGINGKAFTVQDTEMEVILPTIEPVWDIGLYREPFSEKAFAPFVPGIGLILLWPTSSYEELDYRLRKPEPDEVNEQGELLASPLQFSCSVIDRTVSHDRDLTKQRKKNAFDEFGETINMNSLHLTLTFPTSNGRIHYRAPLVSTIEHDENEAPGGQIFAVHRFDRFYPVHTGPLNRDPRRNPRLFLPNDPALLATVRFGFNLHNPREAASDLGDFS